MFSQAISNMADTRFTMQEIAKSTPPVGFLLRGGGGAMGSNHAASEFARAGNRHFLLVVRGCLHDTGETFAPARVHSGSLSRHDTTTKCHAGTSHTGVSSPQLLHRSDNFTSGRSFGTVSCKRERSFRCEIGLPVDWNG